MKLFIFALSLFIFSSAAAQTNNAEKQKINGYQIYLKQPAKEIKLLMYEKSFLPIQGTLSEDHKSIIMKDYVKGNKVYVKVTYEDGTNDEFTKSPCFIDPVVL